MSVLCSTFPFTSLCFLDSNDSNINFYTVLYQMAPPLWYFTIIFSQIVLLFDSCFNQIETPLEWGFRNLTYISIKMEYQIYQLELKCKISKTASVLTTLKYIIRQLLSFSFSQQQNRLEKSLVKELLHLSPKESTNQVTIQLESK